MPTPVESYNSSVLYNGDGVTTSFGMSFPRQKDEDIYVSKNDVDATGQFYLSGSNVIFYAAPAGGVKVKIYRKTGHAGRRVDWTDGANITERDLDYSDTQLFYMGQEGYDRALSLTNTVGDVAAAVATCTTKAAEASTYATSSYNSYLSSQGAANSAVAAQVSALNSASAAATSATNAAASATSAQGQAVLADASRVLAQTAATNSAINESLSATSATNAAASASAASTSATNAASSASAASTSATNAAASAVSAAASAASAAVGSFGDGTGAAPGVAFASQSATGLFRPASATLGVSLNNQGQVWFTQNSGVGALTLADNTGSAACQLYDSSGIVMQTMGGRNVFLFPAGNAVEQRTGLNPQTYRLYNTYTDASNYERGFMRWNSNFLEFGGEAAGTGTDRNVRLRVSGAAGALLFYTNGNDRWQINNAGDILAAADASYDLGAAANRPRDVHSSRQFLAGDGSNTVPSVAFGAETGTGFYRMASGNIAMTSGTNVRMSFNAGGINLGVNALQWAPNPAGVADISLTRDAANTLAQRNGTTAQVSRIYNTFTDSSNYERGVVGWSGNVFSIGTEYAGTGVFREMRVQFNGTTTWAWDSTSFYNPTAATYDIGKTANPIRHLFTAGRIVQQRTTPVYGASITINSANGGFHAITATNGTAFTINAPTNPVTGHQITVTIRNTSGGALGAVTWDAVFKLSAWTSPATANSRSVTFVYDGTNWVEIGRTPADVPN